MMTVLEALKEARKLLSNKERWSNRTWAEDKAGRGVRALDPEAVRWCAVGALQFVVNTNYAVQSFQPAYEALEQEAKQMGEGCPEEVNDSVGYEAVLAMYDGAIEQGEECIRMKEE